MGGVLEGCSSGFFVFAAAVRGRKPPGSPAVVFGARLPRGPEDPEPQRLRAPIFFKFKAGCKYSPDIFSAGCKYSPDVFLRGLQVQPAPVSQAVRDGIYEFFATLTWCYFRGRGDTGIIAGVIGARPLPLARAIRM